MQEVKPYSHSDLSKKAQVEQMFDHISPSYDRLNRSLSVGIDVYWRKMLIGKVRKLQPNHVLDLATGTADVALALAKAIPHAQVIGADISEGMLNIGRKKVGKAKLDNRIRLVKEDAEQLSFQTNTFDVATVAFGVRNFERLLTGLQELYRVLRPSGTLIILEFSKPRNRIISALYRCYSTLLMPRLGQWLARDGAAYRYLFESVQAFPDGEDFMNIARKAGFSNVSQRRVTFGIVTLYSCSK